MKFYKNRTQPERILSIIIIFILCTVGISGICSQLLSIDVMKFLPPFSLCLFHELTGIPCPGCGMTRALLCFGQLKIEQAVRFNPFSIPLVIAMIFYLYDRSPQSWVERKALTKAMGLGVIIVWLFRL